MRVQTLIGIISLSIFTTLSCKAEVHHISQIESVIVEPDHNPSYAYKLQQQLYNGLQSTYQGGPRTLEPVNRLALKCSVYHLAAGDKIDCNVYDPDAFVRRYVLYVPVFEKENLQNNEAVVVDKILQAINRSLNKQAEKIENDSK